MKWDVEWRVREGRPITELQPEISARRCFNIVTGLNRAGGFFLRRLYFNQRVGGWVPFTAVESGVIISIKYFGANNKTQNTLNTSQQMEQILIKPVNPFLQQSYVRLNVWLYS